LAITAVVLAGGPPDRISALQPGAVNKTFVTVGGVTLVERTVRALRASNAIGTIVVVAPPQAHGFAALAAADIRRSDGARIADSLRSGLDGLPGDSTVLIATGDLPVLDAAAVDDFVVRALERDLDAGYGIVERGAHMTRYPHIPHTWARLRDGTYCGGGLFTLRPRILPALDRFLDELGRARKAPLRLASIFGYDVLVKFALRRLRIVDAERRATMLLGAPVGAVLSPYPQIAVNVDRQSDVALAEALV